MNIDASEGAENISEFGCLKISSAAWASVVQFREALRWSRGSSEPVDAPIREVFTRSWDCFQLDQSGHVA